MSKKSTNEVTIYKRKTQKSIPSLQTNKNYLQSIEGTNPIHTSKNKTF